MEPELGREAADRVCRDVEGLSGLVVVVICVSIDMAGRNVFVALNDGEWCRVVEAEIAVVGAAGHVSDAARAGEDGRGKNADEEGFVFGTVALVLVCSGSVDEEQLQIFELIAAGPEGERRVVVDSSDLVVCFFAHVV